MNVPTDYERVLRDDDWLRRMARRLVQDPERAEDLVQETWLASMRGRRQERPWLFGTLRNLVRQSRRAGQRRRDHERRSGSSASETSPPTDDVVADLTLRSLVAEELLSLEEPLRTTLWLRFVKDHTLVAIARRTNVSVATVHDRLARGLTLLRQRLDRAHGGERSAWAGLLLSEIESTGALATLATGIAMGTASKLTIVTLALAGATYLWLQGGESHSVSSLRPQRVAAEPELTVPSSPSIVAPLAERQDLAHEAPAARRSRHEDRVDSDRGARPLGHRARSSRHASARGFHLGRSRCRDERLGRRVRAPLEPAVR